MQRQDGELREHTAARVHDRARRIARLADDRRIAGAEQRVLHLLDNTRETLIDDFDGNRVDHAQVCVSMIKLPNSSTSTDCSGHTTVVASYCWTMAGPSNRCPARSLSRA